MCLWFPPPAPARRPAPLEEPGNVLSPAGRRGRGGLGRSGGPEATLEPDPSRGVASHPLASSHGAVARTRDPLHFTPREEALFLTLGYGRPSVLLYVNKVVVFMVASRAPGGSGRRGGVESGSESRAVQPVQLASSGRFAGAPGRAAASPCRGPVRGKPRDVGPLWGWGGIRTLMDSEPSQSHALSLVWKLGTGLGVWRDCVS